MSVAGRGPDRRGWAGSALAALIRRRFSRFLLVGAVTGIASLSTVLLPWASKSIVDALGAGFSWLVFLRGAALLFGALILRSAAGGWASFLAARIQLRLLREILEIIHTRILKVPFLEMKRYQSGQLASHTLNDARLLVSGFGGAVNALIRFPVEIVSLLAFLAATDLGLAGLGLAAMASAALFSHWKSRATARMADRAIRQNAALHALVGENLALNKIIRLFGRCTGSGHGGCPRGRAGPQRIVFASFVA